MYYTMHNLVRIYPKGRSNAMSSTTSATVDRVIEHLCSKGLFGDIAEMCESRGDCVFVVTCPDCKTMFTLDEDDYDALLRWSESSVESCGVNLQT